MVKGILSIVAVNCLVACSTTSPVYQAKAPLQITDRLTATEYWVSTKIVKPKFPVTAAIRKQSGCARFEVTIDETGATTDINFIESFPANQFVQTSEEALRKWRWKSTESNSARQPIRRVVQLDFYDSSANNLEVAKAFCAV
ncbi:energy transducer TonB [Alteromonas lipotrueiana]|uniref:energy transducer TonB n=1 Tax=Alteromonas lipotrueiana TaxID=2803815 RepID=UPI001C471622|nr:energy transducer TonB [Alteromonas lipotrueiana]